MFRVGNACISIDPKKISSIRFYSKPQNSYSIMRLTWYTNMSVIDLPVNLFSLTRSSLLYSCWMNYQYMSWSSNWMENIPTNVLIIDTYHNEKETPFFIKKIQDPFAFHTNRVLNDIKQDKELFSKAMYTLSFVFRSTLVQENANLILHFRSYFSTTMMPYTMFISLYDMIPNSWHHAKILTSCWFTGVISFEFHKL